MLQKYTRGIKESESVYKCLSTGCICSKTIEEWHNMYCHLPLDNTSAWPTHLQLLVILQTHIMVVIMDLGRPMRYCDTVSEYCPPLWVLQKVMTGTNEYFPLNRSVLIVMISCEYYHVMRWFWTFALESQYVGGQTVLFQGLHGSTRDKRHFNIIRCFVSQKSSPYTKQISYVKAADAVIS